MAGTRASTVDQHMDTQRTDVRRDHDSYDAQKRTPRESIECSIFAVVVMVVVVVEDLLVIWHGLQNERDGGDDNEGHDTGHHG